jgi:hypothetical protein
LARVAAYADGWYGFNLARDEVAGRLALLSSRCREADRDPATLEIAVSLRDGAPADAAGLADVGVTELVVVASPPGDADEVGDWVRALASQWGVAPEPGH